MPNERVQTEVIPLDNYCLVGYHCSPLGSLSMAKSTDSKVGFPTLVLKIKKQFRIDSTCVNSATSDILKAWFQKLEILAIKPENRWNIDKARIIKG